MDGQFDQSGMAGVQMLIFNQANENMATSITWYELHYHQRHIRATWQ